MRKLTVLACITVVTAGLVGPPAPVRAAAATIGNACHAQASLTTPPPAPTVVMTGSSSANPRSVVVPSTGVITAVTFDTSPSPAQLTEVKTVRPTGVPGDYTVVAESSRLPLTGGIQSFAVRLPVLAGDLLGTVGTTRTDICATGQAGDALVAAPGDVPPGTTASFTPVLGPGQALPLVATVEPDGDGDGYGDDSQDGCPRSARSQASCPVVTLVSTARARRKKIRVEVLPDHTAPVQVTGSVRVRGRTVTLSGGTQTVESLRFAYFDVPLPRIVRKTLAQRPPSRKTKATLTVSATDTVGVTTTEVLTVRLRGTRR